MVKEIIKGTDIENGIKTTVKGYKEKGITHITKIEQEKEFILSEKIREQVIYPTEMKDEGKLKVKDVKEFIRLLKGELLGEEIYDKYEIGNSEKLVEFIDKLAGPNLIKDF